MAQILIADDLEGNRYYLESLLKGHGHMVFAACNGAEALALARKETVDLIVSDILMPVMDGFDLCRECKKDDRLAGIPFVFYTATYADPKDREFGLSLGADYYLVKPTEPEFLLRVVDEALGRRGQHRLVRSGICLETELQFLQRHNEALVRKLESKMVELENTNRRLARELGEHRQAEIQLQRMYAAIENAGECIIISDFNGLVEYVNPAFRKTMGIHNEKLTGRSLEDLAGGGQGAFFGDLREKVSLGKPWEGRLRSEGKDNEVIEFAATFSPIVDSSGRVTGFVSMLQDITVQKNLENQLVQAQKMEAIGTLAGGIAHDFNNLLGIIMGYADLALYSSIEGSKIWDSLNIIHQTCDRAKNLVKQILAVSRKAERKQIAVDLCFLIRESLKLLQGALPSTIEIRTHFESEDGVTVQGDPGQIQQVILNIATNAAHAIGNKAGSLEFILKQVECDVAAPPHFPKLAPGRYVLLSIRDTGCGMDEGTMARIFEPFYTTKQMGEGTGLGLSVANGIVQSHGGTITVDSKIGHGSTFNLYLPVSQGVIENDEGAVTLPIPAGVERILFVDDEQYLGDVGEQILGQLGYRVTAVTSSRDALELFRSRPDDFDMIVTDQTIPYMTGTELATEVLRIRPELPIILCTGFNVGNLEEKAKTIGIKRVLIKPLTMQSVARIIRSVLDDA